MLIIIFLVYFYNNTINWILLANIIAYEKSVNIIFDDKKKAKQYIIEYICNNENIRLKKN